MEEPQHVDVVGVGIGPFNLSLAALLAPTKASSRFFDYKDRFQWYPGLLFPESTIQVSFLKDLVTLIDPTSPYSFLAYLANKKRLYRFINARFPKVPRQEFEQYFQWACTVIPGLSFGCKVESITLKDDTLAIDTDKERMTSSTVVLGTGLSPKIPACAQPHLGSAVFHAHEYLCRDFDTRGKRVLIVGGGQTSAELLLYMLRDADALPEKLIWITRRSSFLPLDDSPFTNELFTPEYSNYFFQFPHGVKQQLIEEQKLASDGISEDILEKIYRRLYELDYIEGKRRLYDLYPHNELATITRTSGGYLVSTCDYLHHKSLSFEVDCIVLCTGFEYTLPECLDPIAGRIYRNNGSLAIREDFSVEWDGPPSLRIYLQNAARQVRGVADPNLSLMAWRSATIINSILGTTIYDIDQSSSVFGWMNDYTAEERC